MGKRLLALLLLSMGAAACAQAVEPATARVLLVRLSDREPVGPSGLHRGGDNSWTLSTSGGGAQGDEGPDRGNGARYATQAGERVFRVREGEVFRLELPTVQSMQFHVPVPASRVPGAAGGASGAGASAPASASSAATTVSGASTASTGSATAGAATMPPSVSGVVYYEAVGAFQARLRLRGTRAVLELLPVLAGTVRASSDPPPGAGGPVVIEIDLGRWTGLGGGDGGPSVGKGGAGTRLSAAPVTEDSVWVRVDQDRPEASPEAPGAGRLPGDTRIGTSPRP